MSGDCARRVSIRRLPILGLLFSLCWAVSSHGVDRLGTKAPADSEEPLQTVSGTLAMLDVTTGKGMLKTDLGKPVFFEISRPDLFAGLSIGNRVAVQLDKDGRAVKAIEALPAEVHEPPPPPVQ